MRLWQTYLCIPGLQGFEINGTVDRRFGDYFRKRFTHSTSNDDLVLWGLSNPAAPRAVQKLSGVVKWLQDERNFIYVLNGNGLWVVSKPADHQPKPEQAEPSTYGG